MEIGTHVSAANDYLPIADHGLIGDLHSAALVGTNGTIDWYCCPRFDAPSIFAAILDAQRGGCFELAAAVPARTRQFYFPDTNLLITRFSAPSGVGEVQDFMPVAADGSNDHPHRLIRLVTCVRGSLPFRVRVAPRFGYGTIQHTVHPDHGHVIFATEPLSLRLSASVPVELEGSDATSAFTLTAGESVVFILEQLTDGAVPEPCTVSAAEQLKAATISFWRKWLAGSQYRGRWREMVHRSALTIKLLIYAPTGAIVAAPTTSLPEQLGGERNFDYRYVWIRDAAFCVYALLRLGFGAEAEAFMGFLRTHVEPRPGHPLGPLQIMYGIDGRADLPERELTHLAGYAGSTPVREGNAAANQLQLDIYGELIDAVYLYDKWYRPIPSDYWEALHAVVDWLCDHWNQPDEGIWETRGGRKNFVYSRLMSWVAIDRAMRIATRRGLPAELERWRAARDAIYRAIMERGWSSPRQAFVQYDGGDVLDAAVLMMPLVKFVSPLDPRWLTTLDAVGADLVSDALTHRYDPQVAPDGLAGEEGTFSICSFWYVEALTRAGRLDEARLAFEKMLTYANHVGLYAEQIAHTGEQLGNFPQAYTHLALISAAVNLDRALDKA
jgi:GH15 family glucan-1,4-alpha-glucosidase